MNKHCSPFILAPIAFLLAMHAAQGMTLGDVQLKSYIGQRFKADIPYHLNADERTPEECHQLLPSNNDVTFIGSATVQVIPQGDGKSGVVRILGRQAAEEPIVGFALHFECDSINLTRDYNVFLDPAPVVDVPIVSSATTTTTAPTSLEARKSSKAVSTTKEVTLQQLAEKYYPINSAGYERYLNKLKRNNPDFAETDRIPVGSMIVIPPRPKVANAAPKAPSMVSVAPEQSHLRLEGDERQPPAMSSGNTKITPEAYVKELEAKVAELSELRKKLQLEIDALDQRLAQSQSPVSSVMASAPVANASAVVAVASAPAAPTAKVAEVKPAVPRVKADASGWQWPTLGILGLLGLGFVWWRRRASNDSGEIEAPESILSVLKTNFVPRRSHPTQASIMHNMNTGFEVMDEESNRMDQAQFFLAQGDTLHAIELLQQLLAEDPLDAERWLMLFRVYRQQGMKSDYIQLAHKFRAQTPKPSEDDWELVRSIGFKLAPEHPLFTRVEAPSPKVETPVDLAISSLEKSTQVSALTASAEAVSETINTRATSSGSMSDVNLIDLLQPKPAPAPAHFVRPTIAEEAVDIQLPPISGIKDPVELSSLEELEFNVEKLEFEDEKVPKE